MNASGMGPMPKVAAEAALAAVQDKMNPRSIVPDTYLQTAEDSARACARS
jgi:hypothetical protein